VESRRGETRAGAKLRDRQTALSLAVDALAPKRGEIGIRPSRHRGRLLQRDGLVRFAGYQARQDWLSRTLTYLVTLGRKPGAFDHTPVFRDWKLPACFATLRADLERHHGSEAGARRFVRVLQLLGEHPLDRVRRAIEACQRDQLISAETIIERTRSFAAIDATRGVSSSAPDSIPGPSVHVPLPDLTRFNQLLNDPEDRDGGSDKALTVRADAAAPECQGSVIFAC
jgi:hypothetical protein